MTHLTDKIAEFVQHELPAPDMAAATRHVSQCAECREQVEKFRTTFAMLKSSPDVDPPRRILFEFEKPPVMPWLSRWLAPMAASAAVAFAVVHFHPAPQPQIVERVRVEVPAPAATTPTPAASPTVQPVDYEKMLGELNDLRKREATHAIEIQRMRGLVESVARHQDTAYRDMQVLSARLETR